MDYKELLKSPKWQKLRLEVLQRDNFTCCKCGSNDKPLNVHHLYYKSGNKPWEYPLSSLITLCEDCHGKEHSTKVIKSAKGKMVLLRSMLNCNNLKANDKIILSYVLVNGETSRTKIANVLGMTRQTVIASMKEIERANWLQNNDLLQHGYFELKHAEKLKSELLIFYSYLLDKAKDYEYCLDTRKSKLANVFCKTEIAITKLLHRLYEIGLAQRLDNGKLKILN